MNLKELKEKDTDRAWNNLYHRLEQDGLLQVAGRKKSAGTKPLVLKWTAAVAALLAGAVWLITLLDRQTLPSDDQLTLYNAKGEPTLVTTFEDGSIICLSEQASLEYPQHFAADKRMVSLRGEAFFEVSRSPGQPFIIQTQTATIEVLGTSFSVKSKGNDEFSLSVRTGKVKVTAKADNQTVLVNPGETVVLLGTRLHTQPTTGQPSAGSYLHYIYFKDQTLNDIVRIINLNSGDVRLKVAPEVGERRITVTFRENTPEEMARILCQGLNLDLRKQQNMLYIGNK